MNIFVGIRHKVIPALAAGVALVLCLLWGIPAHAQSERTVYDDAGILSDTAEENIAEKAREFIKESGVDAVVCTANSLGGLSLAEYAKNAFDGAGAGISGEKDGILLLISFDAMHSGKGGREIYIYTSGYAKNGGFNEYGIERITGLVMDKLSGGDYEGACAEWLTLSKKFLKAAKDGKPYSADNRYKTAGDYLTGLLISFIAGLVIAAGVCFVMVRMMRTSAPKSGGSDFVKRDSFHVTKQRDIYVYSTVKRMKRESAGKKTLDE